MLRTSKVSNVTENTAQPRPSTLDSLFGVGPAESRATTIYLVDGGVLKSLANLVIAPL